MQKTTFEGADEHELRRAAGESIKKVAATLAEHISPDDAWRLMLAGSLMVLLPLVGNEETVATLRELADDIERGKDAPKVN